MLSAVSARVRTAPIYAPPSAPTAETHEPLVCAWQRRAASMPRVALAMRRPDAWAMTCWAADLAVAVQLLDLRQLQRHARRTLAEGLSSSTAGIVFRASSKPGTTKARHRGRRVGADGRIRR
jgi:hypothetical protein